MTSRKPALGMDRDALTDRLREILSPYLNEAHMVNPEHLTRTIYEIMSAVEEYVDREVALDNIELAEELTERAARFTASYRAEAHEASYQRAHDKIHGPIQGTLF